MTRPTYDYCEACGKPTLIERLDAVQVLRATMWSPAEYVYYCKRPGCARVPERDEAYERANSRYKEQFGSEL